jgi:sugar-specific transcriptional regulator TrmB
MTADDLPDHLDRLGEQFDFGEYEIEAYLAVLEYGTLTASEIADETDIPQPRVYDTVRSLAENGFVEIQESRPIEVLAIDPQEAFGGVRSTLDDVVDGLQQRYTAPSRTAEAVSLVTSRQTILRYFEDVIASAEYELLLSLTPDMLARFEDELTARRDAGVTTELLLSPTTDVPAAEEYDYSRVATVTCTRRGLTTPLLAVADGSYSVYTGRSALRSGRDQYAVIFNRSELGFLVSGFLNTVVWPTSTTLAETGHERPYPRRYATIRRCVRDTRDSDGPFYAAVNGRDVESGDYRTVTGEVVDTSLGVSGETAAITLDVGDETLDVGGQAAALEDIEAYELAIDRDSPPEL